jgi:hypothetical protein
MSALLTAAETGEYLRCRDRRTIVRRLAELGVPVVPAGRSFLVREVDLERAVAAHARPPGPHAPPRPAGITLAPGRRLWDGPPTSEAPPPARGRGLGTGGGAPVAA